jgi:hypothetical protein
MKNYYRKLINIHNNLFKKKKKEKILKINKKIMNQLTSEQMKKKLYLNN